MRQKWLLLLSCCDTHPHVWGGELVCTPGAHKLELYSPRHSQGASAKHLDVEFEQQMRLNQNTVLQGSGSSAQTAVMWR
eukprot:scaffold75474_cov14-Tisochrysis_lutea.AAC.2